MNVMKTGAACMAAIFLLTAADLGAQQSVLDRAGELEASGAYEDARELYLPLADAGIAEAQFRLGELYRTGRLGLDGLPDTVSNWLKKAAARDHVPARRSYGLHLAHWRRDRQQKKVRRYLTTAADAGDANAQFYSALFFMRELYKPESITRRNDARALDYLRQAAGNEVLEAQLLLASMLLDGQRFAREPEEGARWMERAAERGVTIAQRRVGALYAAGSGVEQDAAAALRWYQRAAERGDRPAMAALAEHYRTGNGVAQDEETANEWERRLATTAEPPELVETPLRLLPKDWENYGPGYVVLEFAVTETGEVDDIEIVYADGAGAYNDLSVEAAAQFRYEPAQLAGRSVRTEGIRYCMPWLDKLPKGAFHLGSDSRPTANIRFEGGRGSNRAPDLPQVRSALTGLCFSPDPRNATAETVLPLWAE